MNKGTITVANRTSGASVRYLVTGRTGGSGYHALCSGFLAPPVSGISLAECLVSGYLVYDVHYSPIGSGKVTARAGPIEPGQTVTIAVVTEVHGGGGELSDRWPLRHDKR